MKTFNRRKALRGIVGGGAVSVALPFLDCFLDNNGTALADGRPMPIRFGTWVWGLGVNRKAFVPVRGGNNYELMDENRCLKPVQSKFSMITELMAYRDSYENFCHYSGWVATRSGQAPALAQDRPGETIDVTVANKIGRSTRFKMLTATAQGDNRKSLSYEGQNAVIAPEFSEISFYNRLFGPGFQDPNLPTFTPDPQVVLRKSVLSGVNSDIKELTQHVGATDKARLDQYFTGVRELERQLEQQLTKPDPIPTCKVPGAPASDLPAGIEVELLAKRHNIMTDIMVLALACDQTRVFNMFYSPAQADTVKKGYDKPHHTCSHEEPVDPVLGYQKEASYFAARAMESWLYFIQAFDKFKEGDRSLLDNTLILAHSDQGLARVHSLDQMAMFLAGNAGGKIKNGYHIPGNNRTVTQVGYTALRIMGIDVPSWGTKSNLTTKPIDEVVV